MKKQKMKKGLVLVFACAALSIALFRLPPLIAPQGVTTQDVIGLLRF